MFSAHLQAGITSCSRRYKPFWFTAKTISFGKRIAPNSITNELCSLPFSSVMLYSELQSSYLTVLQFVLQYQSNNVLFIPFVHAIFWNMMHNQHGYSFLYDYWICYYVYLHCNRVTVTNCINNNNDFIKANCKSFEF